MSSLLIVSSDPSSVDQLERLADSLNLRWRSVFSPKNAEGWLTMSSFDAILIDGRYQEGTATNLLKLAWKHNPLMIGGVFNFYGSVADHWMIVALGGQVFTGDSALSNIEKSLAQLGDNSHRLSEFSILVVEDLDSPRDIICAYIEAMGYSQIEGTESVAAALATLRENPRKFGCVITDINMPEQSGHELISQMRRDSRLWHIPVIVLTAHASADNLLEAIVAGASGFLVKPPKKQLLRAEIEKCRRIFLNKQDPRLCHPEEAYLLEAALDNLLRV